MESVLPGTLLATDSTARSDSTQTGRRGLIDSAMVAVAVAGSAVLGVAYAVLAGRALGPALYSEFVAGTTVFFVLRTAVGPINATVTRFSAQYAAADTPGAIRTLGIMMLRSGFWIGTATVAAVLLLRAPLATLLHLQSTMTLPVVVLAAVVTGLASVPHGQLRGMEMYGAYCVTLICESSGRLALGMVLLSVFASPEAALAAYVLAAALALYVAQRGVGRRLAGTPRIAIDTGAIPRVAVPFLILMLISACLHNLDMLVVKIAFSPQDSGVYGGAFTAARTIGVIATPFATMVLPEVVRADARSESIVRPVIRNLALFLLIVTVPVVVFAAYPEEVIRRLYGTAYAGGAPALLPLALARILGQCCHVLALAATATGRYVPLLIYGFGLLVQVAALARWHESFFAVTSVLVLVEATLLGALVLWYLYEYVLPSTRPR